MQCSSVAGFRMAIASSENWRSWIAAHSKAQPRAISKNQFVHHHPFEYEYEYRFTEYEHEYEKMWKLSRGKVESAVESVSRGHPNVWRWRSTATIFPKQMICPPQCCDSRSLDIHVRDIGQAPWRYRTAALAQ